MVNNQEDRNRGAMLAMMQISASLLGEIAMIKATFEHKKPETYVEQFLARINAAMPDALASIEKQASSSASSGYEDQVEKFDKFVREVMSFS